MFREDDDDYFESRESRDPDLWHCGMDRVIAI